jgi:hypothetical protein
MLSRRDAVHHLLRLGLLQRSDLVDGSVTASEYTGRNHLVRVEIGRDRGFVVKQPRVLGTPDAATMWTEAAVFWLSANEPAFAALAPYLPRYHHYDERNALLTTELIVPARSLYELLSAPVPSVRAETLATLGRVFAHLHGEVSRVLESKRTRRLFRTGPAWALTLGADESSFAVTTEAGRVVLQRVLEYPGAVEALALARDAWRDRHLIHGDAKSANVLVREDGALRVIDWEIAAVGDGLWDVAGFVHSLFIPSVNADVPDLETAERRARPLLDALWDGYVNALAEPPPGDDPRVTMLRLTGTRLVQTCLETTLYTDRIDPLLEGTLRIGLELMTRPEQSRARWSRAA